MELETLRVTDENSTHKKDVKPIRFKNWDLVSHDEVMRYFPVMTTDPTVFKHHLLHHFLEEKKAKNDKIRTKVSFLLYSSYSTEEQDSKFSWNSSYNRFYLGYTNVKILAKEILLRFAECHTWLWRAQRFRINNSTYALLSLSKTRRYLFKNSFFLPRSETSLSLLAIGLKMMSVLILATKIISEEKYLFSTFYRKVHIFVQVTYWLIWRDLHLNRSMKTRLRFTSVFVTLQRSTVTS